VSESRETIQSFERLAELAQTVTASLDLSVVLEAVTQAATNIVPGSASRIWSLEGDRLVLRAQANFEQTPLARSQQFRKGEGLVGRIWAEPRVLVVDDVQADSRFMNTRSAQAERLVSFLGLPLVAHGGVQGVLSLFTRRPHRFTEGERSALESFGTQAAIAIENARLFAQEQAARSLAEASEQRLLDLVNSVAAIVAEADATTWRFSFVSRSAEAILGYPVADWMTEGFWARHLHPDDRERAVAYCLGETAAGRHHTLEYRMVAADGRSVWVRDTVRVIPDAEGRPATLQCLFVDITERKQAADIRARLLNQIISAQEDERRRIARELHDETAQSLASLLVGLDVLASTRTLKAARAQVQELHAVAARALGEVRLLARGLRPAMLDDLGLVAAVEWYTGEFQRSRGIAVYTRASGVSGRLPAPLETALYRIMQEALANVARHAEARAASVVIERSRSGVTMAVSDDGRGFDVGRALAAPEPAGRLGLHSMRERAGLVDGSLEVSSVPGVGTRILVEIPLPDDARDGDSAQRGALGFVAARAVDPGPDVEAIG
jgi:PAS domain S-box-containing protein